MGLEIATGTKGAKAWGSAPHPGREHGSLHPGMFLHDEGTADGADWRRILGRLPPTGLPEDWQPQRGAKVWGSAPHPGRGKQPLRPQLTGHDEDRDGASDGRD